MWVSIFYLIQFSHSVVSDFLQPHEPQHARPPYPSPKPRVYPNPCPLSRWCHPAISSSIAPFSSWPQSLPASGSFPRSQFFTSGGQGIRISSSTSVLSMNTQDWSPWGWTGWVSLQSKRLPRVFSNTTVQKHQFFSAQLSLESDRKLWIGHRAVVKRWTEGRGGGWAHRVAPRTYKILTCLRDWFWAETSSPYRLEIRDRMGEGDGRVRKTEKYGSIRSQREREGRERWVPRLLPRPLPSWNWTNPLLTTCAHQLKSSVLKLSESGCRDPANSTQDFSPGRADPLQTPTQRHLGV